MQKIYKIWRSQSWLYDIEHDSMHPHYRRVAHLLLRALTRVHAVRYTLWRPDWAKEALFAPLVVHDVFVGRKPNLCGNRDSEFGALV